MMPPMIAVESNRPRTASVRIGRIFCPTCRKLLLRADSKINVGIKTKRTSFGGEFKLRQGVKASNHIAQPTDSNAYKDKSDVQRQSRQLFSRHIGQGGDEHQQANAGNQIGQAARRVLYLAYLSNTRTPAYLRP